MKQKNRVDIMTTTTFANKDEVMTALPYVVPMDKNDNSKTDVQSLKLAEVVDKCKTHNSDLNLIDGECLRKRISKLENELAEIIKQVLSNKDIASNLKINASKNHRVDKTVVSMLTNMIMSTVQNMIFSTIKKLPLDKLHGVL